MDDLKNRTPAPIYLVFLGPPGSGKGTQADLLHDTYGWVHLSTGDLFRENIAKGTELGLKVKDILASGALVSDDITVAMVVERLHQPDTAKGVVFDGFPRTRAQAEALRAALEQEGCRINRAIYFKLADQIIIERLSARRVCPQDGAVYNLISKPPKRDNLCDNDDVELMQRPDDKAEVVQRRLDEYREKTAPVIDYYHAQNLLEEIDATREIDVVQSELVKLIEHAS
jgi:adenylate kinase